MLCWVDLPLFFCLSPLHVLVCSTNKCLFTLCHYSSYSLAVGWAPCGPAGSRCIPKMDFLRDFLWDVLPHPLHCFTEQWIMLLPQTFSPICGEKKRRPQFLSLPACCWRMEHQVSTGAGPGEQQGLGCYCKSVAFPSWGWSWREIFELFINLMWTVSVCGTRFLRLCAYAVVSVVHLNF